MFFEFVATSCAQHKYHHNVPRKRGGLPQANTVTLCVHMYADGAWRLEGL